ncbi:transposase, partial [Magnetococcus sp. PR-3]|uniref:transposase n=1 Tax=Magnetococcus sp. PR-3 TaxID=3120355 RepID=UPI002FCDE631
MRYAERNHKKRVEFLAELRRCWMLYGKENIVYFDESGFEESVNRQHAWASRGVKVYGETPGRNHKRSNLIMAQRGKKWLAPVIFDFSCNADLVETWIEKMLLPELKRPSVIVMDNAAFHRKEPIKKL